MTKSNEGNSVGAPGKTIEEFVIDLLWNEHPECCGCPVVGAEYMGSVEYVCCGQPEGALLNDKQIVASLRSRFAEPRATGEQS